MSEVAISTVAGLERYMGLNKKNTHCTRFEPTPDCLAGNSEPPQSYHIYFDILLLETE